MSAETMSSRRRLAAVLLAAAAVTAFVTLGVLAFTGAATGQYGGGGGGAGPSADQYGGPGDVVAGAGKVEYTDFPGPGETTIEHSTLSAHSGPNGEDPHGSTVFRSPFADGPQQGEVTCMVVNGRDARVGGEFREPFLYAGLRVRWWEYVIRDHGSPGGGGPSDDQYGDDRDEFVGFVFVDRPRPPEFSPCNTTTTLSFRVVQGNFVVKDETTSAVDRIQR